MKVLQVLAELNLAGAQIMAENLAVELKHNGHEVRVISLYSYDTPITRRLKDEEIGIYFLDKKSGFDIALINRLKNIINEYQPDVIHTHTYALKYVALVAMFNNIHAPIIHTIHNIAQKESSMLNLLFERYLFRTRRVKPVAISPSIKDSIIKFYKLDETYVPMIFNGIDISKCVKKDSYEIDSTNVKIIHIGRFCEQKNHDMIIEAMALLKEKNTKFVLSFYGDGPLIDGMKSKTIQRGLEDNIKFCGLVPDTYEVLNKSDIFILPSLWEGMPMTLIEAMGTGLPSVVTPVGGVLDMVENEVTGLVSEINAQSICDCILRLIEDENLREKIGKQALSSAKRFTVENMGKDYFRVYSEL